jgi:hypothetical protein
MMTKLLDFGWKKTLGPVQIPCGYSRVFEARGRWMHRAFNPGKLEYCAVGFMHLPGDAKRSDTMLPLRVRAMLLGKDPEYAVETMGAEGWWCVLREPIASLWEELEAEGETKEAMREGDVELIYTNLVLQQEHRMLKLAGALLARRKN